ncbi:MAG TPA: hypothetical protein IAA46_11810, partial [Candidatus Gemmiger avium]|nr:hypothetical protein [Candidatus Gemmiger avium]
GDNGGSSNSGNTGSNGGSTVTPAVPAPAPVQNLTAAPAAVTVQTLAAPAAAETVEEEAAPLAQTAGAHWALLNLLFTLAGIALAIPAGLRRMGAARLAPVAVAACAVVILILTLDLTLPMGLADIRTLPLAALAAAQLAMLLRRAQREDACAFHKSIKNRTHR